MFSPPLPEDAIQALASVVADVCEFDLGLSRPDDPIDLLIARPAAGNPIEWLRYEGLHISVSDALHAELHDRLKELGTTSKWPKVMSFGELMLAWCGREPSAAS